MSKAQILFSTNDHMGVWSTVQDNFWNRRVVVEDGLKNKLFPRGKAFERLHRIQFEKHIGGFEDE